MVMPTSYDGRYADMLVHVQFLARHVSGQACQLAAVLAGSHVHGRAISGGDLRVGGHMSCMPILCLWWPAMGVHFNWLRSECGIVSVGAHSDGDHIRGNHADWRLADG